MMSDMDDRLGRHDDILRAHRERFEAHKKWLQGQRGTPSFQQQTQVVPKEPTPGASPRPTFVAHAVPQPNTTIMSRNGATVYDDLIEKGRLYEQKREQKREEKIRKEVQELRPAPKVSAMATAINRDEPIEIRFMKLENERRQVAEFNKTRILQKDEEDHQKNTFHPKISKKGKRATSRTSADNTVWQQKKEEQLENLRIKKITQEMADVRGTPEIDERSARLAEKKKVKEGLSGYSHLDTMLERDRLARLATWERQQNEIRQSQPGNPKITAYAAMTNLEGDVYDRLYNAAFDTDARRSALQQSRLTQDGTNYSHSPRITGVASNLTRERPVEEDLLERHEQAKAAQEEQIRYIIERERDLHTPAINPVSDEIAARLPESSRERLYKPRSQYYDPTEYPFQPVLNQNSLDIDNQKSLNLSSQSKTDSARRHAERIELLYQREKGRQDRLDTLRTEEEQKRMSECTFQPMTHQDSSEGSAAPLRVYNRVTQWSRKRDKKLEDQRLEKERQVMVECSFRPTKSPNSPRESSNSSNLYGGDGKAWGFHEFIDRQREARNRRDEKATKGIVTGDKWKNESTVPMEFHLGRRDKSIRALQKPLEAPIQPPSTGGGYYTPGASTGGFAYAEEYDSNRSASYRDTSQLPPAGTFSERTTKGIIDR